MDLFNEILVDAADRFRQLSEVTADRYTSNLDALDQALTAHLSSNRQAIQLIENLSDRFEEPELIVEVAASRASQTIAVATSWPDLARLLAWPRLRRAFKKAYPELAKESAQRHKQRNRLRR